jgi:DNA repair protein RecO (recombination protein O)
MKQERTQAIILRRTNYGEADRILQIITPQGRRAVIARGSRKEKSKLAGGIELFAVSDIVIHEGKGNLGMLTGARLVHFYRHIIESYDRLQSGYEVIRLVAKASEQVDEPEWFAVLEETFAGLDTVTIDVRLVQTWFLLRYADFLGHGLGLHYDCNGDKLDRHKTYLYDDGEKSFKPSERGEITGEHIKLLRLIATKPIQTMVQVGGIGELLGTCYHTARRHAAIEGPHGIL